MRDRGASTGPTTVGDYAAILWRRKLLVLPILFCVPVIAGAMLSFQKASYSAGADVLVRTESVSATLALVPNATAGQDPQRLLETQARLARLAAVANDAIARGGLRMSTAEFLADSSVSADPGADILSFGGVGASPEQAIRLANAYARSYTRYRSALDRAPIAQALATLRTRLAKLRVAGQTGRLSLYESLLAQQRQLLAIQALPSQDAVVVALATAAAQTAPRIKVGILAGLVAGMFLAVAAALLREAIDQRPRSTEELSERLGLRVLGRIPRTTEGAGGTVMLTHPASIDAETYRVLRMNFEHVTAEGGKVVAVTSAVGKEGKSTVSSNLAITLARAGRSVVLVDCDPVRAVLRERFRTRPAPGLVELALGDVDVYEAMTRIALPTSGIAQERRNSASTRAFEIRPAPRPNHATRETGSLHLVTCTPTSLELADSIVTTKLESILAQLRRVADVVILDSAPLITSLGIGVSSLADSVLVVANVSLVRRSTLDQLAQALDELPTPKLGLVLTGVVPDPAAFDYYAEASNAAEAVSLRADTLGPARPVESPAHELQPDRRSVKRSLRQQ